ncbi:hypothetical protein DFP72DRAFT_421391 [Ephemerocybe angulata]|uniref:Calpain catalytic domain-containing protein n=1 Tax=Ephemerocybe angulata TaxID=980116 RepID=A0A8H6MFP1_9AGAR|nr:hypothetical protein DFP72DRAFT_421391 [Tulosesus angulatus]
MPKLKRNRSGRFRPRPRTKVLQGAPSKPVGLFVTKELKLAIEECTEKVQRIAKECRARNKKFRDLEFDIEFDEKLCLHGFPGSEVSQGPGKDVQRVTEIFDDPHFFPLGGAANSNAIKQGELGDCWFLSALATVSCVPNLIEKICVARDERVGIYGFIFHGDRGWTSIIVDDMLFTNVPKFEELDDTTQALYHGDKDQYHRVSRKHGSSLLYAKAGSQQETWVPLIEKAYAKFYGNFSHIEGGWTREAVEDLTGGVAKAFITKDILDGDRFWREELLKANQDRLFACSFDPLPSLPDDAGEKNKTVNGLHGGHAYSVLRVVECLGKRFVVLRNPWGHGEWTGAWSDGSREWTAGWLKILPELQHTFGNDGQFVMDYDEFLHCFTMVERTYLFDETWILSSQWVHVRLTKQPTAWSYGGLTFDVTIPSRSKTILVLSQLNERAFRSIPKSSLVLLDLAVVKKGDKIPLEVASQARPLVCRSITVELDLDEGDYFVYVRFDQSHFVPIHEPYPLDGFGPYTPGTPPIRPHASSRVLSRVLSRKVEAYSLAENWDFGAKAAFTAKSLEAVIQQDLDEIEMKSALATKIELPEEFGSNLSPPRGRRSRSSTLPEEKEGTDGEELLLLRLPEADALNSGIKATTLDAAPPQRVEDPPTPERPREDTKEKIVLPPRRIGPLEFQQLETLLNLFKIGFLNLLAIFGLTLILPTPERIPQKPPPDEPTLPPNGIPEQTTPYEDPAMLYIAIDSDTESDISVSSQASPKLIIEPPSPIGGSFPTPPTLLPPLPLARPAEPRGGGTTFSSRQEWKDLLKDETGSIVLGLRVYTQTKDPAEISSRIPTDNAFK